MTYQPQHIVAPDGTRLVVITEAEYSRLRELSEEARDVADAKAIADRIKTEGTMPAAVLDAVLDRGITAVKAWREYRGLTQAELARRTGVSQPCIGKIENGAVYGRPATRKALAAALDAPVWALDDEFD